MTDNDHPTEPETGTASRGSTAGASKTRSTRGVPTPPPHRRVLFWLNVVFLVGLGFALAARLFDEPGSIVRVALLRVGQVVVAAVGAAYIGLRIINLRRERRWRLFGWHGFLPSLAAGGLLLWCVVAIPISIWRAGRQDSARAAHTAGLLAESAEVKYFEREGRFTDDLGELIRTVPKLSDHEGVTFTFTSQRGSGYNFSTHAPGTARTFYFSSQEREVERYQRERAERREQNDDDFK